VFTLFFAHNPTDYLNLNDWHYAFNVKADSAYISRAISILLTTTCLFLAQSLHMHGSAPCSNRRFVRKSHDEARKSQAM